MTSSERHLKFGQPRWDYSIQQYKSFRDVFCERDLFSILFLACGRTEITRRCLLSTVDAVARSHAEIEWIFMENGGDEANYQLFQNIPLKRKVVIRQDNYGINEGLNQMWAISRGEYCVILENDWENRLPQLNFVDVAHSVFKASSEVGIVQLRAVSDNHEQWGRGKAEYWPWDCSEKELERKKVRLYNAITNDGHLYKVANHPNAWNNNPCVIRKSIYRQCGPLEEAELGTDPRHGETSMQQRTAEVGFVAAHIGEIYYHIGHIQTKVQ